MVRAESDGEIFWIFRAESAVACPAALFCPLEDRKDKQHHTTNKNRMREIKNGTAKKSRFQNNEN